MLPVAARLQRCITIQMLKVDDIAEDQIVFYDTETTSQFAPYAELKMIGVQYGLRSEPELVESWGEKRKFRNTLANPDILKVQFNGINFDDLVLYRHGYPVDERNRHDIFLMAKTVAPRLPAYALKFLSWYYFGDMHLPEMEMNAWMKHNGVESLWQAPKELLAPYCLYDVTQTKKLFCLFWEVVQRPLHWTAYTSVELPMGLPMEEIMLRGGEYLDEKKIDQLIATLQDEKLGWEDRAWRLTNGKISNPNSVKQVGAYLRDEEGIELALTDKGNFSLKKADVLEFLDLDNPDRDRSQIIRALFEVRRINNSLSYYRNYLAALHDNPEHSKRGWIPKQYSLSGASTRRILSNSKHKLNFQNPNEAAKEVQIVPKGWVGFWIDATQVENVVHIYESGDYSRRKAYEADEHWNEYVWLANIALNSSQSKAELDSIPSPINPAWSVYKQFKTTKLALNFGMGVTKYSRTAKLPERAGQQSFRQVLSACPAIKQLQQRVAQDLTHQGYVQDVFGAYIQWRDSQSLQGRSLLNTGVRDWLIAQETNASTLQRIASVGCAISHNCKSQ
jgi:DNA polymerase I-like protein with 3'-5' exonuclease and polymerase domains